MEYDEYVKVWKQCITLASEIGFESNKSHLYRDRTNQIFGYLEPLNTASTLIMDFDSDPRNNSKRGYFSYTDIRIKYGYSPGEIGSEVGYSDSEFLNWCATPELRAKFINSVQPSKRKKMFKLMVGLTRIGKLQDGDFTNEADKIRISKWSAERINRGGGESYIQNFSLCEMFPNEDIIKLRSFMRECLRLTKRMVRKNESIFRTMENVVAAEMLTLGVKPKVRR